LATLLGKYYEMLVREIPSVIIRGSVV